MFTTTICIRTVGILAVVGVSLLHLPRCIPQELFQKHVFEERAGNLPNCFAFSPDGKTLVYGTINQNNIRICDLAKGKVVANFDGTFAPLSIAFSPDGDRVAVGGPTNSGKCGVVWDFSKREQIATLQPIRENIRSLSQSANGKLIALSYPESSAVRIWSHGSGKVIHKIEAAGPMAFSPDSINLATLSPKLDSVIIWNVENGTKGKSFPTNTVKFKQKLPGKPAINESRLLSMIYTPDGKTIVGGGERYVYFWNAEDGRQTSKIEIAGHGYSLSVSSDGKLLAVNLSTSVQIFDMSDRKPVAKHDEGGSYAGVAFSPDGKLLAFGHGPADNKLAFVRVMAIDKLDDKKPKEKGDAQSYEQFAGTWKITYAQGHVRTYTITGEGSVSFQEEKLRSKLTTTDSGTMLDFGDGKLERLSVSPKGLRVEHFNPSKSFPNKPYIGTGAKAP